MISEAIGKILGMAMAYGVSALGLLLAYYNYRKRVVKAERIMSSTAWIVVGIVFLAIALGGWTIYRLAGASAVEVAIEQAEPPVADDAPIEEVVPGLDSPQEEAPPRQEPSRWPWIGILLPAAIFLFATWVTAALHHHFSTQVTGSTPHESPPPSSGEP